MEPRRLLTIALLAEGAVGVIGALWMMLRHLPFDTGPLGPALAAGIAGAALMAVVNHWVLRSAPDVPLVRSLRSVYRNILEPMFVRIGWFDVAAISIAAGVCEEILFRGAVQQELGLLPASVLFGAAHLGGSGTVGFGIWAAVIGVFLGTLAMQTQGLLAPIVAHAAYDALALAYIRRKAPDLGSVKYPS
jgi:membrane protease YdiL (CAAX protease family)